jgi:hypothetical protein
MGYIKNQVSVCGFFSSVILEHKLTLKNKNILYFIVWRWATATETINTKIWWSKCQLSSLLT